MNQKVENILVVGVGGQGTVLASRLIAAAKLKEGNFVRTAETIGMAQRGGCVVSHVRVASEEKASLIPDGDADLILGFEPAEVARNIQKIGPEGACVVNTNTVMPVTASLSGVNYSLEEMKKHINDNCKRVVYIDANEIGAKLGSSKVTNIILIGAAIGAGFLDVSVEKMTEVIKESVKERFIELNIKALNEGYKLGGGIN